MTRPTFECVVILFALFSFGQETPVPPRPRVGLVLEGGGALGLAHIGVLQWMEDHKIPIHYVTGTSMGGLIGGAYATGMNPAEVRTLVTSINWDEVLRGTTEFADLSLRRKQDRRAYPNSLEFGLRKGVRFPGGFNSGQQVNLILDRIALPYSGLQTFDDLPIPFRCVATELTSRSLHVFKDGSLSQALRATMSIPGFFNPVTTGGKTYVDGGLLNNLPTDVARDMGAEVIVAIHLDTAPLRSDAILSSFAVLAESFNTVVAANEHRGMELADIVIRVDLADFSSTSYHASAQMIARGYEAAERNSAALSKFSVDTFTWQQYLTRRDAKRLTQIPVPSFVQVRGTTEDLAKSITHQFRNVQGQPIDESQLEEELTTLTGTGRFSGVGYKIAEVDHRSGLEINVTEKQYAPPTINPIIIINGAEYNNVRFSAGARLTLMDVGKPVAELRTDVLVGSTYRLASEYFRPISASPQWFLAPHGNAETAPVDVYSRGTQLAVYRESQVSGGADLGYIFDRFSEFRLGYDSGWLKYSPDIGNRQVLPSVSGRQGVLGLRYTQDRLDNPVVPEKGVAVASNFDFYDSRPNAVDGFPALQSTVQFFKPFRRRESLYFSASGGTTFGFSKTGIPPFTLGGPFRLSAYGTNEIFTNQYMLYRVGYFRRIGQLPPILGDKVYFFSMYELAKPYGTPQISRLPMDVAAGVLVETLFGPLQLGGSWGDSGHHKIYFTVGRIF